MRAPHEMDTADSELKQTIKKIWPMQAKKIIDYIIPPDDGKDELLFWVLIFYKSVCFSVTKWLYNFTDSAFPSAELIYEKLTVGKIYAGLLILDNWRTTRFGQIQNTGQVSFMMLL